MLLGYHLLWSTTANVVGSPEQADRWHKVILENNYYIGGAVNPRDSDLKITYNDNTLTFNGAKHFTTGAAVSDLIVLEGALHDKPELHIFAFVETRQAGIKFAYNWDNIGLRLTESGGVTIENVSASWSDALGWDAATKQPDPAWLGIQFGSLLLPTIQLVFINFYLGIAQGALDFAKNYTLKNTRAWPFGGDVSPWCFEFRTALTFDRIRKRQRMSSTSSLPTATSSRTCERPRLWSTRQVMRLTSCMLNMVTTGLV